MMTAEYSDTIFHPDPLSYWGEGCRSDSGRGGGVRG
jgi:hypothetical protein